MLAIGLMSSFEDGEEGKEQCSASRRSISLAAPYTELRTVCHGYNTVCKPVLTLTQKECALLSSDYEQMVSSPLLETLPSGDSLYLMRMFDHLCVGR